MATQDDDKKQQAAQAQGAAANSTLPSTATPPIQQAPDFSGSSYGELEDFIRNQMKDVKVETPEERKKRERREKVEGAINGIADMGMALGNLFYATKGAPNAYNPQNSLSAKYQARMEKAKADRERNYDRYMNYALTLGKLKDDKKAFDFKTAQARQQQENWEKVYQAGRDDHKATVDYRNAQIEAQAKRAAAQDAKDERRLEIQERNAANNERRTNATISYQNRRLSQSEGGNGSGKNKPVATFLGKDYASLSDYKRDVIRKANAYGIPTEDTDMLGEKKPRRIDQIAAEVEEQWQEERGGQGAQAKPQASAPKKKQERNYSNTKALGL